MTSRDLISVVIPAHNEEGRIEYVLDKLKGYSEVIVVDDASRNPLEEYLCKKNIQKNVRIIRNETSEGYLKSLLKGISLVKNTLTVTMDADGEHDPADIPFMVDMINEQGCDIVFGRRPSIARPSERFLLKTARFLTGEKVKDSGTGFRVLKTEYAKQLRLDGRCTCGLLLMECSRLGMNIGEVKVRMPEIDKPRRAAWEHFPQFFIMLKFWFLR